MSKAPVAAGKNYLIPGVYLFAGWGKHYRSMLHSDVFCRI